MNDDLPDGLLADLYGIVESLRHVLNAAFPGGSKLEFMPHSGIIRLWRF